MSAIRLPAKLMDVNIHEQKWYILIIKQIKHTTYIKGTHVAFAKGFQASSLGWLDLTIQCRRCLHISSNLPFFYEASKLCLFPIKRQNISSAVLNPLKRTDNKDLTINNSTGVESIPIARTVDHVRSCVYFDPFIHNISSFSVKSTKAN